MRPVDRFVNAVRALIERMQPWYDRDAENRRASHVERTLHRSEIIQGLAERRMATGRVSTMRRSFREANRRLERS